MVPFYRDIQQGLYDSQANAGYRRQTEADYPSTMSHEVIKNFNILIPSATKEQQKIGQFFSKYDFLISAQHKEIDKLKDIKKSLLQKMFV